MSPADSTGPIEVLYLVGTGRSGSTLLGNMLDAAAGVFSAGELRYVWERGLLERGRCGCGDLVTECPLWRKVFDQAFGGPERADAAAVMAALGRRTRLKQLPSLLRDRKYRLDEIRPETDRIVALYRAIADVTAARVVVDSSKLPTYALLLEQLPEISLRVVHLIRDPRATAYSWQRPGATGAVSGLDEEMDRFSATKSSFLWSTWNGLAAHVWADAADRYLAVRYDDLIAQPVRELDRIAAFAGLPPADWPFDAGSSSFRLSPNHTVAGNPNRMRSGTVALRVDDEWRTELSRRDRVIVDTLTWPTRRSLGVGARSAASP